MIHIRSSDRDKRTVFTVHRLAQGITRQRSVTSMNNLAGTLDAQGRLCRGPHARGAGVLHTLQLVFETDGRIGNCAFGQALSLLIA